MPDDRDRTFDDTPFELGELPEGHPASSAGDLDLGAERPTYALGSGRFGASVMLVTLLGGSIVATTLALLVRSEAVEVVQPALAGVGAAVRTSVLVGTPNDGGGGGMPDADEALAHAHAAEVSRVVPMDDLEKAEASEEVFEGGHGSAPLADAPSPGGPEGRAEASASGAASRGEPEDEPDPLTHLPPPDSVFPGAGGAEEPTPAEDGEGPRAGPEVTEQEIAEEDPSTDEPTARVPQGPGGEDSPEGAEAVDAPEPPASAGFKRLLPV